MQFAGITSKEYQLTIGTLCRNQGNQSLLTSGALYAGMAVYMIIISTVKNIKYQL